MWTVCSKRSGDALTASDYMTRALFHAARGRGRTSPNPMVGAVVVSPDGVVLGQGFHARAGEPHAEIYALDAAGEGAQGATLYCTLEPCSHVGRTGPCVVRIVEAGIARVVAAVEDPNPLVRGRGFAYLKGHGVDVEVGLGAATATCLNQPFFTLTREQRPFVVLKAATSLDGCIAESPGRRTSLTSDVANRHAQRVRAEVDAIGVGSGTVLADDPLLTPRGPFRERPLTRVIFDRRLRTPPEARVLSTRDAGPVIIVTTAAGAARRGHAQPPRGGRSRDRDRAGRHASRRAHLPRPACDSDRSCSKAEPACTGRRGMKGWPISCGSTSRLTSSAQAASDFSTGGRFRRRLCSSRGSSRLVRTC